MKQMTHTEISIEKPKNSGTKTIWNIDKNCWLEIKEVAKNVQSVNNLVTSQNFRQSLAIFLQTR